MVRYSLEIDINREVSSFNVENKMNDYIKVQKSILPILEKENYFGEVVNDETGMIIDNVKNKHGDASDFAYFEIDLLINGIQVKITVDVKRTSAKNKFWIHYVNITKENSQLLSPGRTKDINEIGNSSKISLS